MFKLDFAMWSKGCPKMKADKLVGVLVGLKGFLSQSTDTLAKTSKLHSSYIIDVVLPEP